MSAHAESETPSVPATKPRFSLFVATAAGLGYLPKAPGTWGSLGGVAMYWLLTRHSSLYLSIVAGTEHSIGITHIPFPLRLCLTAIICICVALIGVWTADRTAKFSGQKDPQFVVIDEVAGQHLTLLLPLIPIALPNLHSHMDLSTFAIFSALSLVNWKYLLFGFLFFRVFDIWKPFPLRRLEHLSGGWGIMADDWMAGVYAAILLRMALHFKLIDLL